MNNELVVVHMKWSASSKYVNIESDQFSIATPKNVLSHFAGFSPMIIVAVVVERNDESAAFRMEILHQNTLTFGGDL